MDIQAKIERNRRNIWQAVDDYRAHTYQTYVLDSISEKFVNRLAEDNAHAKSELRNLFRKSPVWNEELDCLIINGTRTHNPDYRRVQSLAEEILEPVRRDVVYEMYEKIDHALRFFIHPDEDTAQAINAMNDLAPKAYAPGKKHSRIFRALCDALGVADDNAGSRFQRLYAQFADELSAKKIDFKLYVSLNPAHFITMSNPKDDRRGSMLTSCHSFNSTEYPYNCGCSGYARDNYTFIAFIAADPTNPETLNNRKTMRQIFAYKPYNGLLLQSRLYNTEGGTYGAQEDSKLYRDLVQREISDLENVANLWKTYNYFNNIHCTIGAGEGFGGYVDWVYKDFDAKISIRSDRKDCFESFLVGTYGLCIGCGTEISSKLYCYHCDQDDDDNSEQCAECEEYFNEILPVYNHDGREIYVCAGCRDRYYAYCEECDCYYPKEDLVAVDGEKRICPTCLHRHYEQCHECGDYFRKEDLGDGLCSACREALAEEREVTAA